MSSTEASAKKRYAFRMSMNLGISYDIRFTSDDINDPEFEKWSDYCEGHYLRYYIEDRQAEEADSIVGLSSIHQKTLDMFCGGGRNYKERTMEEKVNDLKKHFHSK